MLDDVETRLVVAVEELVGDPAGRVLVGQLQRFGAEPLDGDDRDGRVGQDAANAGVRLKFFELGHALRSGWWEQTGPRPQAALLLAPAGLDPSPTWVGRA